MIETRLEENTAPKRHWLYGFNMGLLVVVGAMILSLLMIAAERTRARTQWDISSNAINSLAPNSKRLLQEISDKKQNYHLVSLFTDPSNEEKTRNDPNKQAEKRRQVMDLLNLYHKGSSFVQVDDWGDKARDDIEKEIREKYATELKPYEEAIKEFDPMVVELRKFAALETEQIAAAVGKSGAKDAELDAAGQLQNVFRKLPSDLDELQREVHRRTDATLPDWSSITNIIKQDLEDIQKFISLLANPEQLKESPIPKGLIPYFVERNDAYKKMSTTLTTYIDKLTKLENLKVQEILSGVGRNAIVVLGPDSAKIFTRGELFDESEPDQSGQTVTNFKGEEVISSALLAMAHPEKVKVVFVTPTPQRVLQQLYANMQRVLEASNFEVLEWSPPGTPSPDQTDINPPAQGKGVVWVVFPPESPTNQMMMMMPPDPRATIAAVRKHMDGGGQVLFFAEAASTNPMGGGDTYVYDDLLKPFGIQVKSKFTAIQLTDNPNPATGARSLQYMSHLEIVHFEDHEITTPIQGYPTAFFPGETVTVVDIAKPAPAGAEPKVLVRTPNSPDYWGETDFRATPKFDQQTDMASPVPLIALSVMRKGQPDEQRVMAIGTKYFAADPLFGRNAMEILLIGGQPVAVMRFPGNRDLMLNSILWLAGYENMIAVTTKANTGSRFTVSNAQLNIIRVSVIVIVPLLILLLGSIVWSIRHR